MENDLLKTLPMVSIIIPVFNGSNYLREAIESALNQTYTNVEVIVVNDGSDDEDKTKEIALSFAKKISYYEKKHEGAIAALNFGIDKIQGEYVSFLSHDNRYGPDKIKEQVEAINHLEDKQTIIYGGYYLIDENSKVIYTVDAKTQWSEEQLQKPLFPLVKGLINTNTLFMHKSHFNQQGKLDEQLLSMQDVRLWFQILRKAKVFYQQESHVETRIHKNKCSLTVEVKKALNNSWIRLMHSVLSEEMRYTMGSCKAFYDGIVGALEGFEDYKEAYNEAKQLSDIYEVQRNKNYKVSIIIPFYNRIPLVEESIKSALAQTYKNIEVLVIDDGSTDDTSSIQTLIETDQRAKYIKQEHLGKSATRNNGIEKSTGEYIAFLDSDDLFVENKIEKQLNFMLENEYVFSHTSYKRMNMEGIVTKAFDSAQMKGIVFPGVIKQCMIAMPTVMLKKTAIRQMRFVENMEVSQDICFWTDLAYHYELGGLEEYLSFIRVGPETTINNTDKVKKGYLNRVNYIFQNEEYLKNNKEIYILLKNFSNTFND